MNLEKNAILLSFRMRVSFILETLSTRYGLVKAACHLEKKGKDDQFMYQILLSKKQVAYVSHQNRFKLKWHYRLSSGFHALMHVRSYILARITMDTGQEKSS
jgi:hypothetical protein